MTQPNGEGEADFAAWEQQFTRRDWLAWFRSRPHFKAESGSVDEGAQPSSDYPHFNYETELGYGAPVPLSFRMAAVGMGAIVASMGVVLLVKTPVPTQAPAIPEQVRTQALTNVQLLQRLGVCADDLRQEVATIRHRNIVERDLTAYGQAIGLAEAHHIPCTTTILGYEMLDATGADVTVYRGNLVGTGE